jgi:enoyl-CoA hydratase/carnithine racemase
MSLVNVENDGNVSVITMDNTKTRNALSTTMVSELAAAFEELHRSTTCRAIVLTGANKTFCSGGDITEMGGPRGLLERRDRMAKAHHLVRTIVGGTTPVIAAVQGFAYGAGLSLAAACDWVVSAQSSSYSAAFARVGLIADMGLFWTLAQRVGNTRAKRLCSLAEAFGAEEALKFGLTDVIVPDDKLCGEAIAQARLYADGAPLSIAMTKAVYARGCPSLESALDAEVDFQPVLGRSEDHANAIAAFREKRKPIFVGR